jgi:hypothetical protein
LTVTVTVASTDPCELVAVSVYEVVMEGDTNMALPVTVPMPWSMDTLVASVVLHFRRDLLPL